MKSKIIVIVSVCLFALYANSQKPVMIHLLNRSPKFALHFNVSAPSATFDLEGARHISELDMSISKSIGKKEILTDSTQLIRIDHLKAPVFMNFNGFPMQFLVTPGDSILVVFDTIRDSKIREIGIAEPCFFGKNAQNYNFRWSMLASLKRPQWADESDSWGTFLNRLDSVRYVNEQMIKKNYQSDTLQSIALEELKMQEYTAIQALIYQGFPTKTEDYIEIKRRYFPTPFSSGTIAYKLKDIIVYSGIINAGSILFYSLSHDLKSSNSIANWNLAIKDTIEKYFDKYLYQYLLVHSLRATCNLMPDSLVDEWYSIYHDSFDDPLCKSKVEELYTGYKISNKPLPEYVLSETITSVNDGTKGTIQDLILSDGNKYFIYNWGTWSKKSITTIQKWQQTRDQTVEEKYKVIFLSFDSPKDIAQVKVLAKELGISAECYLLDKGFLSNYAKYLRIQSIPLSINFDENGVLVNFR